LSHSSLTPEDLVRACTDSFDRDVWEEFIRRFHRVIATTALRTAQLGSPNPNSLIDDLVQETYLKLCADDCRLLRTFRSRSPGSIFGYIKVVTANVVRDHLKSLRSQKRGLKQSIEGFDPDAVAAASTTTGSARAIEQEILLKQIDVMICSLSPSSERDRNRTIFGLYYRQGFTAEAIAGIPSIGLNTKGVESVVFRLTRQVRKELVEGKAREHNSGMQKGFEVPGSL
jgi:RNA polymerase sigma-70 factor (ECF subfamily)